jgi:hypothetical protein
VYGLDQDDNTSMVTDSVIVNPANIKDSVLHGTKGKGREEPIRAGRADITVQAATSELPERSSFRVASFASYDLLEQVYSATDTAFKKRQEDPCMHEAEPSKLQHADQLYHTNYCSDQLYYTEAQQEEYSKYCS